LRGLRLVLRGDGELILLVAADLPFGGHVFSRIAHMITMERIHQAVAEHGIEEFHVTHFGAVAEMGGMVRLGH